jgi:hypothetical protein
MDFCYGMPLRSNLRPARVDTQFNNSNPNVKRGMQ